MRKQREYWTKEKCAEEALKYENRTEFQLNSSGIYVISRKNKWLDDICLHMIERKKPNGYWTKERCTEEALKHETKSEFCLKSGGAYNISKSNGWFDEICLHMKNSENKCDRCIYAYEFSDNYVYVGLTCNLEKRNINRLNDKKDQVTKHKIKTGLEPVIKQLTDYINKDEASVLEGVYKQKYIETGWFILNVAPTGGLGGGIRKWSKEKCQKEANKYKTRNELRINSNGAYESARKKNWLNEICSHMDLQYKSSFYWTKERCTEEALKYETRMLFKEYSSSAYSSSIKNKWLDEISSHMIEIRKHKGYWTKEKCHEEALKYDCRKYFLTNSAYSIAANNNWLDDICSHMIKKPNIKPSGYWTYEKCKEESSKYKLKSVFRNKSCGAYNSAKKHKWLNEFYPKK
jgi:hypothetical protein